MKYKPKDKVRMKRAEEIDEDVCGQYSSEGIEFLEKYDYILTIKTTIQYEGEKDGYYLMEGAEEWNWFDDQIVGIESTEPMIHKYKPKDKVVIVKDKQWFDFAKEALIKHDYIFTIKARLRHIEGNKNLYYTMEEVVGSFMERSIEEMYEEYIDPNSQIESRYDILDL